MANTCRSCGAVVRWGVTATGKLMPVEAHAEGNIILMPSLIPGERRMVQFVKPGVGKYIGHFAQCPQAKRWRQNRS